jgi:uncharacterized membrane protein
MNARVAAPSYDPERRRATRQLLMFVRASFLFVGTMPFWLPLLRAWVPLGPVGLTLDALFMLVCHRMPERTLELAGVAMPICSRCAGIFAGLSLGMLVCWPRPSIQRARWALGAAGLLMLGDVLAQDFGLHPMWHATRLATGALLGYIASVTLVAAIVRERGIPDGRIPSH